MIREVNHDSTIVLECDACPEMPDYDEDPGMNWRKSCIHIEAYIDNFDDSGKLRPTTKYQMDLSPWASWLCRDPWTTFVTFETGAKYPDRGDMMMVEFTYDSEYFTSSRGQLGFIMPEDGRQSIRNVLWDWVTNELLKRQPTGDTEGIRCPQTTHSAVDQLKFMTDCGTQEGINAHIACIVFENCCCYCYRKTMGQDANFGMDGVQNPSQQRRRAPRPGSASPTPPSQTLPTTNSSSSSSSTSTQSVNVPNPNAARPPWMTYNHNA